jgi:hypothetical protein
MEHARERCQVLAMSLIALGAGVRLRIGVNFISRERVKKGLWRKRVGVEPTIRPAKGRITGFEGRERHRTLFASASSITGKGRLVTGDWWDA